ncbi:MAG: TlpA disulfide reductase family protein [Candidatus Competibacteraceae bacterium]
MKIPTGRAFYKPSVAVCTAVFLSCVISVAAAQEGAGKKLQSLVKLPDKPVAVDFSYLDIQGQMHSLSDYCKVVVINFWATWCAPCRKEMLFMQSEPGNRFETKTV